MDTMDSYLDSAIGDNTKLLTDLLRSLQKEQDSLQKQLSGVGSMEGDSEWVKVVSDVKTTISELGKLSNTAHSVSTETMRELKSVETLKPLVEELSELEQLHSYLLWAKKINQLCEEISVHLTAGHLSEALGCYSELSSLCVTIENTACSNLKHFAFSSKQYWYNRLTETLASNFSSVLKDLQWPFTTSAISSKALDIWAKSEKKFTELFNLLAQLDDRGTLANEAGGQLNSPLFKPLELLVQPLKKRFKFHFSGERKTNSKEKPEWYLTQVSNWIRDHSHFLENRIQPLLDSTGFSQTNARLEFIRGLLQEVELKLEADIAEIVYNDSLMSHLIDELLLFERELRNVLQYPKSYQTPFRVLLGEVPFHKWLSLEKAYAVERVNGIVSSEFAWQPAYNMPGADDTMVPQCTEAIMELIKGITDRYNIFSSIDHQIRFLELQRDLLLEFHRDLYVNAERQLSISPLDQLFMAYLNASNYIATVLKEWGEQIFFLELHYTVQTPPEMRPLPLQAIQQMRRQDSDYAKSEGSAFSVVLSAFSSLVDKLKESLVNCVLGSVKASCYKYKKEKWHSMMAAMKDEAIKEVSPSAGLLVNTLSEQLSFIESHLSPLLSRAVYDRITSATDSIIFNEVILTSHFSEGGAEQLSHDITKAIRPVLSKHADEITKRTVMEKCLESVKLLKLLPGSAKLLQELLQGAVRSRQDESYSAAVTSLSDMGIHSIEPEQAEQILRLRILPS